MTRNLPAAGIYKITCFPTQKVYIGQSMNIKKRIDDHRRKLRGSRHENVYLQSAVDKYGIDMFKFEYIEYIEKEQLTEREQYWIDFFDSMNPEKGFNLRPACIHAPPTEETKEKIRQSLKGRMPTEYNIQKRLEGSRIPCSEEKKKKIGDAHRGMKMPAEGIAKSWATRKANGNDVPWNKGSTQSEETKAKVKAAWAAKRELKAQLAKQETQIQEDFYEA